MGFLKDLKDTIEILKDSEKRSILMDAVTHPSEYKDTGSIGERHTYRILDEHFHKSTILRNVYLEKKNGLSTEIDLLAVTAQGILVVESKNLSGTIYGSEEQKQWTQFLPPKQKFSFPNPVIQNETHIKALKFTLNDFPDLIYFSIIVFSDRCTLKSSAVNAQNTYVIQRFDFDELVNKIRDEKETLSDGDQVDIINRLKKLSRPKKAVREQHVENVKSKCQFCGADLVEKTRKADGNKFLGCSTFPKCKFTRKI